MRQEGEGGVNAKCGGYSRDSNSGGLRFDGIDCEWTLHEFFLSTSLMAETFTFKYRKLGNPRFKLLSDIILLQLAIELCMILFLLCECMQHGILHLFIKEMDPFQKGKKYIVNDNIWCNKNKCA